MEKRQRGGVIFNPKIYVADFGNFKQGFLSMKLIQKRVNSGFMVCFFSRIVLRKIRMVPISGNHVHTFHTIWPSYLLAYMQPYMVPPIFEGIVSIIKRFRVAELGSLSSGAKMAMKVFVKRVFTISVSNASFSRVIANLQN